MGVGRGDHQVVHPLRPPRTRCSGVQDLAVQAGLQVGHQQGRGHALARDVADGDADLVVALGQEIEVVAADLAAGDAGAR